MLSKYIFRFFIYSIVGWIWETLYNIATQKKWQNRGFLYGPLCPIYGVGGVSITLVINAFIRIKGAPPTWYQMFAISFVGSAILEYSTSYVMEKLFHAIWWDYSNMPFNINGRICLPASTLFGLAGVGILYGPYVWMNNLIAVIPPLAVEIIGYIAVAMVVCDVTLTVSMLTDFDNMIKMVYDNFNEYMDTAVNDMEERRELRTARNERRIEIEKERIRQYIEESKEKRISQKASSVAENIDGVKKSALRRIERFVPAKNAETAKQKFKCKIHDLIKNADNSNYSEK